MSFLPLVTREIRVAHRRPSTLWLRLGCGAGAFCFGIWFLLAAEQWRRGVPAGTFLLHGLATAGFVAALCSGVLLTSDSVSRERREGTLGLLFLTDLRRRDVLLGKLAAKAILPLYCFLATVPALAVSVIIGGATGGEFWRILLVIVNTLFFSLSLSLFISSWCKRRRVSSGVAFLCTTVCGLAHPVAAFGAPGSGMERLAALGSPAGSFFWAWDLAYQTSGGWFWGALVCNHLLVWVLLIGAALPLRGTEDWRPRSRGLAHWLGGDVKNPGEQEGSGHRSAGAGLEADPIAWFSGRSSSRSLWLIPVAAFAVWRGLPMDPMAGTGDRIRLGIFLGVHLCMVVWLALLTTLRFAGERSSGILEQLLPTRLENLEVGRGWVAGQRKRWRWPLVILAIIDFALVAQSLLAGAWNGALAAFLGLVLIFVSWQGLVWTGIWQVLVTNDPVAAAFKTLWRQMGLPLLVVVFATAMFRASSMHQLVWFGSVVSVFNTLLFASNAKHGFGLHFRELALRPYGAKLPRIESQWSPINWEEETAEMQPG